MNPAELKALRMEQGDSITEAANKVHVSARSWQRYESGDRKIPEGVIHLYCIQSGIDFNEIMA